MATLKPFRALRPDPQAVAQVASVPYDVVSAQEAQALAHQQPLSFLHVSRPEIDLPPGTDPHSDQAYEQANSAFNRVIREAPLHTDTHPSLYVYRLAQNDHEQVGVFGTFAIDEYDSGVIRRHELTRADKEDDRTRHVLALGAQTGPVYLTFRPEAAIKQALHKQTSATPLFDFTAPDGVRHTLWSVSDPERWVELFQLVPRLYIADGHHRAASASRARAVRRTANPAHDGTENYNFFLAAAFPSDELRLLPYHRLIKDLGGMDEKTFLSRISERFTISQASSAEPRPGEFAMVLSGHWHRLVPREHKPSQAIEALDVSVLQNRILDPILGIRDPRKDPRIDFMGGVRGTASLEAKVRGGEAVVAFALHPTSVNEMMAIADTGGIMPPKSTWFEPKLRDGLLNHRID